MNEAVSQIEARGYAVLRAVVDKDAMTRIRNAAAAFYDVAEQLDRPEFPKGYIYNPGNMATSMAALDDYGDWSITAQFPLLRAIAASSVARELLQHFRGDDVVCSLTHSRMRKSYPQNDPGRPRPSTVEWHKDSAPNVGYYGAFILWVPFTPCNDQYVGLEMKALDGTVSRPDLDIGDLLAFPDTLEHRTADVPTSTKDRYSCDMRFFRASDVPTRVHEKVSQGALLSVRAFASQPW